MAEYKEAIGRRKQSSARVRVSSGTGTFTVNDKPIAEYFTRYGDEALIRATLETVGQNPDLWDVSVKVEGGGVSGQRDSVKLGLARILVALDETNRLKLREQGMLTRDSRVKERKKPGLKRARKAPTYTKR
jgi:small subunit ribosomal protein S9